MSLCPMVEFNLQNCISFKVVQKWDCDGIPKTYCIQLFFMVCCFLPHNRYSYNCWLPLFCPTQVKLSKCSTSSEIRMSRRSWSCNAMVIVADVTKVKAKFMSTGALSAVLESWLIWFALVPSTVRGQKNGSNMQLHWASAYMSMVFALPGHDLDLTASQDMMF